MMIDREARAEARDAGTVRRARERAQWHAELLRTQQDRAWVMAALLRDAGCEAALTEVDGEGWLAVLIGSAGREQPRLLLGPAKPPGWWLRVFEGDLPAAAELPAIGFPATDDDALNAVRGAALAGLIAPLSKEDVRWPN